MLNIIIGALLTLSLISTPTRVWYKQTYDFKQGVVDFYLTEIAIDYFEFGSLCGALAMLELADSKEDITKEMITREAKLIGKALGVDLTSGRIEFVEPNFKYEND